eukprot:14509-Hanusia_phi.AAC.1
MDHIDYITSNCRDRAVAPPGGSRRPGAQVPPARTSHRGPARRLRAPGGRRRHRATAICGDEGG